MAELVLDDEQLALGAVVRRFLEAHATEADVRALMATEEGYDPVVWSRLATELGLPGLAIPERWGGSGFGTRELGVVMTELGRSLACVPFLSSVVLASTLLVASGDEAACAELLPGIAAGDRLAAVGWLAAGERGLPEVPSTVAVRDGDRVRLDGRLAYVADGHVADVILVLAATPDGPGVFVVERGAAGLARARVPTLDQTRKQATVELSRVVARPVGTPGDGVRSVGRMLDVAAALLASEAIGGAERCLELAVAHACTREQFGRPIGSFQAIKHMCAELYTSVELGRATALHAAAVAAGPGDDLPEAASTAFVTCSEAFLSAAKDCIQIHGGIGYTWEHPAHLYLKRAKADQLLLGGSAYHRHRVADAIGARRVP